MKPIIKTPKSFIFFYLTIIFVLLSPGASFGAQEPPILAEDEGLFKINLHLPAGLSLRQEDVSFSLYTRVLDSFYTESLNTEYIVLKPGSTSTTIYLPIRAGGGLGKASGTFYYVPGYAPGCVTGYASASGTSVSNGSSFQVKAGEVCEIDLEVLTGLDVRGTIKLPVPTIPGTRIYLYAKSQTKGLPASASTSIYVHKATTSIPYTLCLPLDRLYSVSITNTFATGSTAVSNSVISTLPERPNQAQDIQINPAKLVQFSEPLIEQQVRQKLKIPGGPLYDYQINSCHELTIDGTKIKSLADLTNFQSLPQLTISDFENITPYLDTIGGIKNLSFLTISRSGLSDLTFLQNLRLMLWLTLDHNQITDISPLGELESITQLDLSNNRISDHAPLGKLTNLNKVAITCIKQEDLAFFKNCRNLTRFSIDANWHVLDYSFVKNSNNWQEMHVLKVPVYADLTVFLNLNIEAVFSTDEGKVGNYRGPEALQRHIALNEKARQILSEIIKPGMSDVEKELAIHDYIIRNTAYDYAVAKQFDLESMSYLATGSLVKSLAVCEGYTNGFNLLLNSVGIESSVVYGTANNGSGSVGHAWNMVKLDGENYLVDTTWNDSSSFMPESTSYKYFNVTSQQLRETHSWNAGYYPECTATKYSYEKIK